MYKVIAITSLIIMCLTACEKIQATEEECADALTLAQAAVDRNLKYNQILVCPNGYTNK